MNESVVRIGIVEGEFHWHKHDNDDEFFFVLQGQLLIDLEDKTIELNPNQGVTISKGVMHRPRAPIKTVMLMVETNAIVPTGDLIRGLVICSRFYSSAVKHLKERNFFNSSRLILSIKQTNTRTSYSKGAS